MQDLIQKTVGLKSNVIVDNNCFVCFFFYYHNIENDIFKAKKVLLKKNESKKTFHPYATS